MVSLLLKHVPSTDAEPLFSVTFPTAPHTEVTAKGDIVYSEVVHENVWKLEAYVEEMASGDTIPGNINIQQVRTLQLLHAVSGIVQTRDSGLESEFRGPRRVDGLQRAGRCADLSFASGISSDRWRALHGAQW